MAAHSFHSLDRGRAAFLIVELRWEAVLPFAATRTGVLLLRSARRPLSRCDPSHF